MHITPTHEAYHGLQTAFAHFNEALFGASLPPVLFTLVPSKNARGYFHAGQWAKSDSATADEISLNPTLFRERTDCQTLSTLVHEMVHLWQQHQGKPGRGKYHNAQWADHMDSVGLTPTSTGHPGGKRTGQSVTHMIVDGGPFDRACKALMATGFQIVWKARPAAPKDAKAKSGKRIKYTCPGGCDVAVWGKGGLQIICGECNNELEET